MTAYFAHTPEDKTKSQPPEGWQPLADHLRAVANLATRFAVESLPAVLGDREKTQQDNQIFQQGAYWAGLLHDLGKYRPEFQLMLRRKHPKNERTRHKQAGAARASLCRRLDLAFAIAGHHGGVPDLTDLKEVIKAPGGGDVAEQVWPVAAADCPALNGTIPHWQVNKQEMLLFDLKVRLLFSCLVDADWQDTSAFHQRGKGLPPDPGPLPLDAAGCLEKTLVYIGERSRNCPELAIAAIRREVLEAALAAAAFNPGLFAMTVPTGGGKTLSALAFALAHAQQHGLRRIIYVAPYLSIIEQNAREIRRALQQSDDSDFVFEHHSLAEPRGEPDAPESEETLRRAENWDAPVVVTTSVQFFESLFSNRPGPCRKLHNMANSVVILDECQTLPPDLIRPTCSLLGQFAEVAGCSIVLCTATQPAWTRRDDLPEGLEGVREIVPAEFRLFERLRRVRVHWPDKEDPHLDWPAVAARMTQQAAALCIVNTRKAAREVFESMRRLGYRDALHLSTAMCPAHRLQILNEVRERLKAGQPCRLVSTQLIEAGVDVDFPLVLRELAPLEAIVQSAGRCNREGSLNKADGTPGGQVVVFRSVDGRLPPDRWYKAGRSVLEQDFLAAGNEPDIGRPEDLQDYFQRLYCTGNLDQHHIQEDRQNARFAEVALKYRLIDDDTIPVVALTWEARRAEIEDLLERLHRAPSRHLFRQLGRFQVNLRCYELAAAQGQVASDASGVNLWTGTYDQSLGLGMGGNDLNLVV